MEGTVLDGKYRALRLLGRGGMGAVYEAVHTGTGRRVALKVIIPEALGEGEVLARFRREARASGTIDSQHVVQVLDTGVDGATKSPYLVMELLKGEDLGAALEARGPLPWELALRVVAQAASGLARAHAEGVTHRDIKSANLYLARREETEVVVKVLDFGIAKLRPDQLATNNRHKLTATGAMLGSPYYMSPEQMTGADVDARADVYSLGITLYEALSGALPHQETTSLGALVMAVCNGSGVPLEQRRPGLPGPVYAIVARATAVDVRTRYPSIAEMQAALVALLPAGTALTTSMLESMVRISDTHLQTAEPMRPSHIPAGPAAATLAAVSSTIYAVTAPSVRRTPWGPIAAGAAALALVLAVFLWNRHVATSTRPAVPASSTAPPSAAMASAVPPSAPPVPPIASAADLPAPPPSAPALPSAAPRTKGKVKRKVSSCDPDYTIDERGVKRYKEECMQ